MEPGPYEHVPLTNEDKDQLLTIYVMRRKFLFVVYSILIVVGLVFSPEFANPDLEYSHNLRYLLHNPDARDAAPFWVVVLNLVTLQFVFIGTGLYFWFKNVYSFKKDADSGIKEKVPHRIVKKEYFPMTNQCFVGFDDPDYLHHEIDADTFDKCNEGDMMYLYRAIKSKYVFEKDGRFSIL